MPSGNQGRYFHLDYCLQPHSQARKRRLATAALLTIAREAGKTKRQAPVLRRQSPLPSRDEAVLRSCRALWPHPKACGRTQSDIRRTTFDAAQGHGWFLAIGASFRPSSYECPAPVPWPFAPGKRHHAGSCRRGHCGGTNCKPSRPPAQKLFLRKVSAAKSPMTGQPCVPDRVVEWLAVCWSWHLSRMCAVRRRKRTASMV